MSPLPAGIAGRWLAATAAFTIVGCTWALAIARYGGPDEPAHILRAAAVADGDLLGEPMPGFEPGFRTASVPALLASGDPACYRHDRNVSPSCAVVVSGTSDVQVMTSAGVVPPWYYAAVGAIPRVLAGGTSVTAYRMAMVLICAAILGLALTRIRACGGGAWLIASITPSAWFLLAVVGTSGIEIALVTLAMVEALRRSSVGANARSDLRVSVPLACCLIVRPAAFLDLTLVSLMLWPTMRRPRARRIGAGLWAPMALAAVVSVAWNRWAGLVLRDQRTSDTNSLTTALTRSLRDVPTTVHQAVAALGWNEFSAPWIAQLIWAGTLAFAIHRVVAHAGDRWWHGRWIAFAVLLPVLVEVVVHRRIGAIWQGRYSIPFLIGGVLYAAALPPPSGVVQRRLVAAAICAEVSTLWLTLRRYMVGGDGSRWLRDATWSPPLDPWLLLAVNLAAMVWLAVLAVGSDDVAEHVDEHVGAPRGVEDRQLSA